MNSTVELLINSYYALRVEEGKAYLVSKRANNIYSIDKQGKVEKVESNSGTGDNEVKEVKILNRGKERKALYISNVGQVYLYELIAVAFNLYNENNYKHSVINHKDNNSNNNNLSNLEVVTQSENVSHGACIRRLRKLGLVDDSFAISAKYTKGINSRTSYVAAKKFLKDYFEKVNTKCTLA